jgi:hypothetical protein
MDVVNLRIRYRPMRIGLCIDEGDIEAFRAAIMLASTMWGGRFSPIIPVGESDVHANALSAAFQVDVLYPVTETKAVTAFVDSAAHLKWPDFERQLFLRNEAGADATFLDIYHPVRHLAQDPPAASERSSQPLLLSWGEDDPLKDVLLATCGAFPAAEAVGRDYQSLFRRLKPVEMPLNHTDAIPADAIEMLTPLALTTFELSNWTPRGRYKEPGFYIGSSGDFTDLVNFWNLNASDIDIVFYDPAFEERLLPVTEAHKGRLLRRLKRSPDPLWPVHSALWTKTGEPIPNLIPFGEGFDISVIDEQLWDPKNRWKPPLNSFEEQSILGTVSHQFGRPTVTIQLPAKPVFADLPLRDQKLVVSIKPLLHSSELILCPPFTPELNQYYGREILSDSSKLRSEADSIGVIVDVTTPDLTLYALDGSQLIEEIFASRGMTATLSDAGRVGHRLIKQMGGLQGCRVFKIPGVRELIRSHGPLQSFTKSAAIQTIRGLDSATGIKTFAPHKQLYICSRESEDLKPGDALAYLLEKKMFRVGLSFVCPNCALDFWRHLDSIETVSTCEYCDTAFNVMPQLKDRDWRFRRSGLFGRDDSQAGGIPVSVVLQQLETTVRDKVFAWTTGMDLESKTLPKWKCETDFVLIVEDIREGPQIVLSEVKSAGGEITEADAANLSRVADLFEGSSFHPYIVFAKLGPFSPDEIERCRSAQDKTRTRVIVLSDRELEPYFVYERAKQEFDIPGSAIRLHDLAISTNSIFFNPRPKIKK